MDPEDYVEAVLSVVEGVPAGRVTTYGAVAEAVGYRGPRSVGRVMSTWGGSVPWWRVVRADGSLPPSHDERAREAYADEGTPLRVAGRTGRSGRSRDRTGDRTGGRTVRVDMARAAWWPAPLDASPDGPALDADAEAGPAQPG